MFGVELERRWGTPFFIKYYAVSGIGGGLTMLLVSLLPFDATARDLRDADRRRLGCALRPAAGVRDLLPRAPDPALPGVRPREGSS